MYIPNVTLFTLGRTHFFRARCYDWLFVFSLFFFNFKRETRYKSLPEYGADFFTWCLDAVLRELRRVLVADWCKRSRRALLRRPHLWRHPQVEEDTRLAHVPRGARDVARAVRVVSTQGPTPATAG